MYYNLTCKYPKCLSQNYYSRLKKNVRKYSKDFGSFLEPKLSQKEVSKRISNDEFTCPSNIDTAFSANQIAVNRPVEDRWSAFRIGGTAYLQDYDHDHPLYKGAKEFDGGHLFSVVDGHGGHTNAHAINLLHADYVSVGLSPHNTLKHKLNHLKNVEESNLPKKPCEFVEQCWIRPDARPYSDSTSSWGPNGPWGLLDSSVANQHAYHLKDYVEESLSVQCESDQQVLENDKGQLIDSDGYVITDDESLSFETKYRVSNISSALRGSLVRLDKDISYAALPQHGRSLNKALLRIIMSGSVMSSIYLPKNKSEVYVTQVGDCAVVLGSYVGDGSLSNVNSFISDDWSAELMVAPHGVSNKGEVDRLKRNHPIHESNFIIRDDRLLGELMPFRAFGDIRYKWSKDTLRHVGTLLDLPPNYPVCPHFYQSPPYLDAHPQMAHKQLIPNVDQFFILATDGLWDVVSHKEAVRVVAQHFIDYCQKPWMAADGDSAASRLIRTALGGEDMDPDRISILLSVPANVARYYRDDISVIVVYPNIS